MTTPVPADPVVDDSYPFPEMYTAGSLSLRETRDLVLRDRAWRKTGKIMTATEARAWRNQTRSSQDAENAAG